MRKFTSIFRRAACLSVSCVLAITTVMAAQYSDEIVYGEEGQQTLLRSFSVLADEDPNEYAPETIESDGFVYHLQDIETTPVSHTDMIEATTTAKVLLTSATKKDAAKEALTAFEETRSYSQDGYTGTLTLKKDSIQISPYSGEGPAKSITIHYDAESVDQAPSTITDQKFPYKLEKKTKSESGFEVIYTLSETYKAPKFEAQADYSGIVSAEVIDSYTCMATYEVEVPVAAEGEKLPAAAEIPSEVSWVVILVATVFLIVIAGLVASAISKNKKAQQEADSEYERIDFDNVYGDEIVIR